MTEIIESAGAIGSFLREIRMGRHWTQDGLARRAQISRLTLLRWESGQTTPRLPELQKLLDALGADVLQRRAALSLLQAPRGKRAVREASLQQASAAIGLPVGQGDLLRAMRRRRQIPLETAAGALSISAGTLSRWEKGHIVPPTESLHRLLMFLGGHPEERDALIRGSLVGRETSLEERTSIPERWEAFERVIFAHTQDALLDLGFLALESQAWQQASRPGAKESDYRLLALLFARHADSLLVFRRYGEARHYAERALRLTAAHSPDDAIFTRATVVAAHAAVYQRSRPAPLRGLEILRLCLPPSKERHPTFRNWIMANEAEYLALLGQTDAALPQLEEACRRAEGEGMLRLRQRDLAKLLLGAGRAEEALPLLHVWPGASPTNRVQAALLRARCLRVMGRIDDSATYLAAANADIEQHGLRHLRSEARGMTDGIGYQR